MKKKLPLIYCLLITFSCFAQTYVPDDNFEQALIDLGYDDVLDDYVVTDSISSVTSLILDNKGISSLEGIQSFTALQQLNCESNSLSTLNVSSLVNLSILSCHNNNLSSLDVGNLTSLSVLSCGGNQIVSLDLSNNPMEILSCAGMSTLTSIFLRNDTNLIVSSGGSHPPPSGAILTSFSNCPNLEFICVDSGIEQTDVQTYIDTLGYDDCLVSTVCDDRDGDGVKDDSDNCPGTPAEADVDVFGCALEQYSCPETLISLTSQSEVNAFATNYPNCSDLLGGLEISGSDITDLSPLSIITSISGGYFSIKNNLLLTSLSGLENITSVSGGDLIIENNAKLTSILGLSGLTGAVGQTITIKGNPVLVNLRGLENVTNPGDDDLRIENNDSLLNLTGLDGMKHSDDLIISDNDSFVSFAGFENFEFTGSFYLINNDALVSLSSLNSFEPLCGFEVKDNDLLEDIDGFSNDFSNECSPNVIITNNPNLSLCANNFVCQIMNLEDPLLGVVQIENNKAGCNTEQEILNSCVDVLTDDDNDGVMNYKDLCSSTPSGEEVDTNGCSLSQKTYVPDDNFEQVLIDRGYDTVLDDYVITANISSVTNLYLANYNISDLTGIEDFSQLDELYCPNNQITTIDISALSNLSSLVVSDNQLSQLDVSQNTNLGFLSCHNNNLSILDVSSNSKLVALSCGNNKLTTLNTSQNPLLEDFYCSNNLFTSLDVSQNVNLYEFFCHDNQLTEIIFGDSYTNYFYEFVCHNNQLTSLDLSSLPNINIFDCSYNKLNSLIIKNQAESVLSLDATNNPNLLCIEVDDAAYSTVNWTTIDDQTSFSEDCSIDIEDDDGDGVLNNVDECPNTPSEEVVNSVGCSESQLDDDNDGVMNAIDECPNTPTDELVTEVGCGLSQLPTSDEIMVLRVCDDDGDGLATFDLTYANSGIIGNYPEWENATITFYQSMLDAHNKVNLIPTPSNYLAGSSTVLIRVENIGNEYVVMSMELEVDSLPEVTDFHLQGCDGLDEVLDGITAFDLQLIRNQSEEIIKFYTDSDRSNEILGSTFINQIAFGQVLYGKMLTENCESAFLVELEVIICEDDGDDDGDGVINALDICPETPDGEFVNSVGCSESQLDGDNDGVMNDVDACPDTPSEESVNSVGCSESQLDDDDDGVTNDLDLCVNTQNGESVDNKGCSDSQLDDDGDGVMNDLDLCVNTPNGEPVDTKGCSESQLDDDNDGVVNAVDECPDTPTGETVDEQGCASLHKTSIPDSNFEQALIDLGLDDTLDGLIITSNIVDLTELDVSFKNIESLSGLEYFTNLRILDASDNRLTSIDVSGNVHLETLYIHNNIFGKINSTSTLSENQIQTLDVSENINLLNLNTKGNQMVCIQVNETQLNQVPRGWLKDDTTIYSLDCTSATADDDNDGVLNYLDQCPNTLGAAVNEHGCVDLLPSNFKIEVVGETCVEKNNGQILIEATENYTYTATLDGVGHDFTTTLSLENIEPGEYSVCITIIEAPSFEQCFNLMVPGANTITGKSSSKVTAEKITETIEIGSGTAPYLVSVNGEEVLETSEETISLDVLNGDQISVSSKIPCEGVIQKQVILSNDITVYPNPTDDFANILLPNVDMEEVEISLFNSNEQLLSKKTYKIAYGRVKISLKDKPTGVYLLQLDLNSPVNIKLIKH